MVRKAKKLIKSPGIFFRDYLNKKFPVVLNEIGCPLEEESILLKHDSDLENLDFNRLEQKIDVVFTWVDDKDPEWIARYSDARGASSSVGLYGDDAARFSNHDELRFSLFSVERFLPWVNRIFIVTDKQCPSWLQISDRIRIVDHREIIDSDYLPTFNSHVIEAHLHRIPDLSENFIYFNDDVFVATDLSQGHFFRGNGIASLFVAKKSLREMSARGVETPTLSASLRSATLLKEQYGAEIDHPLVHTYVPLRKSVFNQAWEQYTEQIMVFLPNRFRSNEDLNLATFLVPWLLYLNGCAVPTRDICHYFNVRSPAAKTHYRELLARKRVGFSPHSFCANDFTSESEDGDYQELLQMMLQAYFLEERKSLE